MDPSMLRVGAGYDAHRLETGRKLILGGEEIGFDRGFAGHSDADVLVHAIIDSLLGAASLGDIGKLFPDTDARYKGVSSIALLDKVGALLIANGYRIINIDSVVVLERPKIGGHVERMKANIARALGIEPEVIGIKGKTTEGLGFEGTGEGGSSYAVCLLYKNEEEKING